MKNLDKYGTDELIKLAYQVCAERELSQIEKCEKELEKIISDANKKLIGFINKFESGG